MQESNTSWIHSKTQVCGKFVDVPEFSHKTHNELFYKGELAVERLSGQMDYVPVMIPGKLIGRHDGLERLANDKVFISGQLRIQVDFKAAEERRPQNMLYLSAGEILPATSIFDHEEEANTLNEVILIGNIASSPIFRSTPFGRTICDFKVDVIRRNGKHDKIPCIAWGGTALFTSKLKLGDRVSIVGRFQSREYNKLYDDGDYRTLRTHEISVFSLRRIEDAEGENERTKNS